MSHNIEEFILSKPHDIFFPAHTPIQDTPPFVPLPAEPAAADASTDIATRFDPTTTCPVYEALGYCTFGWKCRFLGAHVQRVGEQSREGVVADALAPKVAGWEVVEDPAKRAAVVREGKQGSMNQLTAEECKALQRKRVSHAIPAFGVTVAEQGQFPYPMAAKYLKSIDSSYRYDMAYRPPQPPAVKKSRQAPTMVMDEEEEMAMMGELEQPTVDDRSGFEAQADDVPMRPVEKKRLDWRGKTYLAPLTTVGNLVSRPVALQSTSLNHDSPSDNSA